MNMKLKFIKELNSPIIHSSTAEHAKYIGKACYSQPFIKTGKKEDEEIARLCHGNIHVCRAAIVGKVLIDKYIKYEDDEAKKMINLDKKLLEIAILFHDTGREDDGEDVWDKDSAENFYNYATTILKVEKEKAIKIAESIANKDIKYGTYFNEYVDNDVRCCFYYDMKIDDYGSIRWDKRIVEQEEYIKNIFQKIIHDADCIDVIRDRAIEGRTTRIEFIPNPNLIFDSKFLDFSKQYGKNPKAMKDLECLLQDHKNLIIEIIKDYYFTNYTINRTIPDENIHNMRKYECAYDCYGEILKECLKLDSYKQVLEKEQQLKELKVLNSTKKNIELMM